MEKMRSVRVDALSVRRSEAASHNELATAVAAGGLSAPEDVVDLRDAGPCDSLDARALAEMDSQARRTLAATVDRLSGATLTRTCSLCAASYQVRPGDLSSGCPACLADLQREAAPMGRESPPSTAGAGGTCDATVVMDLDGVGHEVRLTISAPTVREEDWPRLLLATGAALRSAGVALAGGAK